MCRSIDETFGWLGAILVNFGFISMIGWGAVKVWPLGLLFCALYTALLLAAARFMETASPTFDNTSSSIGNDYQRIPHATGSDDPENQNPDASDTLSPASKFPIVSNLLYALAIAGIGVTGSFLPVNILQCRNHDDSLPPTDNRPMWTTDISALPQGVQAWASDSSGHFIGIASFAFMAGTGTTIFRGRGGTRFDGNDNGYPSECLWEARAGQEPAVKLSYERPDSFITVSSDAACFLAVGSLFCNVNNQYVTVNDFPMTALRALDLFAFNDLLWYKAYDFTARNACIECFNASSQETTKYSVLEQNNSTDPDQHKKKSSCSYKDEQRRFSIFFFFTVALPVSVTSLLFWIRRRVPSMGLTMLVGLELLFVTVKGSIYPDHTVWNIAWWHLWIGLLYLLVLSYLHLVPKLESMRWGLNGGGLLFLIGMFDTLFNTDSLGSWIVLNLLCFAPLILLGMANQTIFLVFLGGFGILLDAWRLSEYAIGSSHDDAFLSSFFIFAVAGSFEVAIGFLLSRYQKSIHLHTEACL